MRQIFVLLLWAASLLVAPFTFAQAGDGQAESQIRAVVQSESDAWNRGDAEAFGAYYAENGSFTNVIGQQLYGRRAFIAQHAMIFSTIYKGSHNVLTVTKIILLRPDVAVVDIDGTLTGASRLPPGLNADAHGALNVKLQEIMTRERGHWQIATFHNVAVYPLPADAPH